MIKLDNMPMPRALRRKPDSEWSTLPDYARGLQCGQYAKVVRSPDTIQQWINKFVPKDEFDRGFLAGIGGNLVSIVEIEKMPAQAKTFDVTKHFASVKYLSGKAIVEWETKNAENKWRGKNT